MSDARCLLCRGEGRIVVANDAISAPAASLSSICATCGGSGEDPRRMTIRELAAAYMDAEGGAGDPIADLLAAELTRRSLAF
jgi:hypothetical protein